MNTGENKGRLFCLDAMRGLDMLFLTWVGPFLSVLLAWLGLPGDGFWRRQLTHPAWGGFTAWDQIMPCFIFMCGAAVPLALKRYLTEDGRSTRAFFVHIGKRFALLWVLGLFVAGRITSFDIMEIRLYNNTLEAIAAGYVIAALALLIKVRWMRFALPFVLAFGYTALLAGFGDMTPNGNFARTVDVWCLSSLGFPEGAGTFQVGNYTWFLTSLMFGAMTCWGSNCTEIVRSSLSQWKKAGLLFVFAALLTAVGWIAQIWIPPVKQVFALSFTARSMGVCIALLAVLYVLTDIWKFRRGWGLVTLFGQFALTAYIARNAFMPALKAVVARFIDGGVKSAVAPELYLVIESFCIGLVLVAVLIVRRRLSRTVKGGAS